MKKAYIYAGISILLWSTIATVSKLLLTSIDSYGVLMLSALFASVALLLSTVLNGKIKLLGHYRARDWLLSLVIGLPGTFLYNAFLYAGTARMAASEAFIINYLWPIMSVAFACILLKERLTAPKCIAFALSFLGVLTVAGGNLLDFRAKALIGAALCVLAAVCYGAFTALSRKWDYDDQLTILISYFATFVFSSIICLLRGMGLDVEPWQWLGLAWNGIFVLAIATVTWALALKFGGTAKISNLAYATPFLSLVWTALILKESISPYSIVGLALILLGIFIQIKEKGAHHVQDQHSD